MYKLFATDVDGTLIDHNFNLCNQNKAAISAAQAKGINIVLCSGRSHESLKFFARDLGIVAPGNFLIGFNGCTIYDLHEDKILFEHGLDIEPAIAALAAFEASGIAAEPIVYLNSREVLIKNHGTWSREYMQTSKVSAIIADDQIAALRDRDSISKIIFIGENGSLQALNTALKKALGDRATVLFSAEYLLEVMTVNTDKGVALAWLCKYLGINMASTIAMGDNYNDIPMIEAAGHGIAVANAVSELKAVANYITDADCENGAVAEVVGKFLLV